MSTTSEQTPAFDIISECRTTRYIYTVLPVTEMVARRAIAIQHDLLDQGQRIGARDVLIAGTAVGSPDPRVLTRNVDEFARIDGLEVIGY